MPPPTQLKKCFCLFFYMISTYFVSSEISMSFENDPFVGWHVNKV